MTAGGSKSGLPSEAADTPANQMPLCQAYPGFHRAWRAFRETQPMITYQQNFPIFNSKAAFEQAFLADLPWLRQEWANFLQGWEAASGEIGRYFTAGEGG